MTAQRRISKAEDMGLLVQCGEDVQAKPRFPDAAALLSAAAARRRHVHVGEGGGGEWLFLTQFAEHLFKDGRWVPLPCVPSTNKEKCRQSCHPSHATTVWVLPSPRISTRYLKQLLGRVCRVAEDGKRMFFEYSQRLALAAEAKDGAGVEADGNGAAPSELQSSV